MNSRPKKEITITEYGLIGTKQIDWDSVGYHRVDEKTFSELENFVLNEQNEEVNIFKLSSRKGYGKVITAQNYVGVVQTKSGTLIEVLPKIANANDQEDTRNIFLKMLKTLRNSPFRNLNDASLKNQKFPILEIFIQLFLSELSLLVKRGIKKNYIPEIDNLKFVKGKIKIKENITTNIVDHSKFVCEYDEFSENTKENRLIKTCLLKVSKISTNKKNQQNINLFLHLFSDVDVCKDVKTDLKAIDNLNRLHTYYLPTLKRVKLFLGNESVVNFKGETMALSLLFPMEQIFESYVANMLKKKLTNHIVQAQDSGKYLIEEHNQEKKFRLRPDIVIDGGIIIADTKWKKIKSYDVSNNYGISQSDMYQLFAYAKKYNCNRLYLIYPQSEDFQSALNDFKYESNIVLRAIPYDLKNNECELFNI